MNTSFLNELFATFGASSWRAAWLIAVLVGLRVLVRGRIPAGVWFVVWLIVAVRLILPFSVPVSWSPYNFTPSRVPAIERELPPGGEVLSVPVKSLNEPAPASDVMKASRVVEATPWKTADVLALVWLSGAVFLLSVRANAAWRFRRRLRNAREADERVQAIARREALGWRIRRGIRCVETETVDAPALFGFVRPWLLFPPGFSTQLNDEELRLVVRHELAHWRRRDLLAQALLQIAVALHWFNPLAWLAARLARADCELACDEFVLRREADGGATAYGSTLLKVLGMIRGRRRPGVVVAILEGKQQLAHRVRMIADYRASNASRVIGGLFLLAVLTAASVTRETHAQESAPPKQEVVPSAPVEEPALPQFAPQKRSEQQRHSDLQTSINDQRKKVDELARKLQEYKETHKTASLNQRKSEVIDSLRSINLEIQRAQFTLRAAEIRVNQIQEFRARGADLTGLSFIADQPLVAELTQRIVLQRLEVTTLSERYKTPHPTMVNAKKGLASTERELERAVNLACDRFESDLAAAKTAYQARQQELYESKMASLELDRAAVKYNQLEREFRTQDSILQATVARQREIQAATSSSQDPAKTGSEPLSVVLQKKPSGWVVTETRGDKGDLANATQEIESLKKSLANLTGASVTGAVNSPGQIGLPPGRKTTLLEVISLAGGHSRLADLKRVRLSRTDPKTRGEVIIEIDVSALMKSRGNGSMPEVEAGDVIFVPERIP